MQTTISEKTKKHVPFSRCKLWQKQRAFYRKEGINAWHNKLPFYATSNPYAAHAYAQIVIRFMQEQAHHYTDDQPFYIIELGAGSGIFSFYLLKELLELQASLKLQHIKFVYVMTDFVQQNIHFWQKHPNLQSYIAQGCLDFACFDAEKTRQIKLLLSKQNLRNNTLKKPLIILANYVFDSLRHDMFFVKDGQLQIGMIKHDAAAIPDVPDNTLIPLQAIDPGFHYENIEMPYYGNKPIDAALLHYQSIYEGSSFVFPIGVLECLQRLQQVANHRMLLIATDKGYGQHIDQVRHYQPEMVNHNKAFSMTVNFYAVGQYIKALQGDCYFQTTHQGIISAAFLTGCQFNDLPETRQAAITYLDNFSAGNLLNLYRHIEQAKETCSLESLIAYLNSMRWDNRIFDLYLPAIMDKIKRGQAHAIHNLLVILEKIAANFYYLPGIHNTLFNIGMFLHSICHYSAAVNYYQQSINYFGKTDVTLYNIALCYYNLQDYNQALILLKEALILNPNHIMVKGWIAYIKKKMQ